jgi:Rad3-related DNA helicase
MTDEERDETLPDVARVIVRLLQRHRDEKGLVHAHSYAIAERLADLLDDVGVGARVRTHGTAVREAALPGWKRSERNDLFVAVTMEGALDLEGDLCRWQVLCKAPYPNTRDSRVARRLEDDRWCWDYRTVLCTVVQACGRVVRSPDDRGATYLADASLLDLFERARSEMPPWFADQVDRMTEPELPAFGPAAAVDGAATGGTTPDRRGTGTGPAADRDGSSASSTGGSGGAPASLDDHPLGDVWGTD